MVLCLACINPSSLLCFWHSLYQSINHQSHISNICLSTLDPSLIVIAGNLNGGWNGSWDQNWNPVGILCLCCPQGTNIGSPGCPPALNTGRYLCVLLVSLLNNNPGPYPAPPIPPLLHTAHQICFCPGSLPVLNRPYNEEAPRKASTVNV